MPRRPARRELPAEATLFVGAAGRERAAAELHLRGVSEAVDAAVGAIPRAQGVPGRGGGLGVGAAAGPDTEANGGAEGAVGRAGTDSGALA